MTWLAVTLPVIAALIVLVARAILRDSRELHAWQAEREREEHILYLARRAREIQADLDGLGDEVLQHVFPPSPNGR